MLFWKPGGDAHGTGAFIQVMISLEGITEVFRKELDLDISAVVTNTKVNGTVSNLLQQEVEILPEG